MNGRQRRETERNIRSNDLLQENKADFTAIPIALTKIAELAEKITKTQAEYEKQLAGDGNISQDYAEVEDAYDAMLDEMRDVRNFARSIAQSNPGIEDKFRIPAGNVKLKDIAAARVFAANGEEIKQTFVAYGMDAGFIRDLREKADRLETALAEAQGSTGTRVGATDTLEIEVKETNKVIDFLDPIVRRIYRANPAKLAAWVYASHIERHTAKKKKDKNEK